ncbi:hypothetical protein D4T97_005405 [Siminovitchia acidinfaciens]|uniref:Uncharacterized protein n=1 Tax=Siminovitchia acidinfaciens TaxID=2321395 RepID=A0A429Y4C6_9BACI|nr:hypothetical protein [Siminovitchia acidinfaciens]RST76217.1 hypothetical protein D4T97_005405 [Siminovitchia acidinfaciens]
MTKNKTIQEIFKEITPIERFNFIASIVTVTSVLVNLLLSFYQKVEFDLYTVSILLIFGALLIAVLSLLIGWPYILITEIFKNKSSNGIITTTVFTVVISLFALGVITALVQGSIEIIYMILEWRGAVK